MASKKASVGKDVVGPTEDDWRARDDHSTLMRAAEVMGDGKRRSAVRRQHRKTMNGMKRLIGR